MFSRFVTWLKGLPERMRHWPELIVEWCTDRFWDFVDFVRDLPRRTRQFLIDLAKAFRDLWILFAEWFFQSIASLFQFTIKAIAYPFILLQTRLDPHPSTVPPARLRISSRGRKISIFSRQLASMTQGGVPLVQSLDVLSDQNEDPKLGYVAKEIANKLTQGYSLSKAVSLYPKVFPSIFPYLVRAGESTGRLVNVIDRLAELLEKEEDLLKQVKGAISYPLFVLLLTSVLTVGLFSTVLPEFASFYEDFDVPLPFLTAFLMTLTNWVQTFWFWLLVLILGGLLYYFLKTSWENEDRRIILFRIIVNIPLIGPIIHYSCLARFCWVMELTQDAGLDIVRAIHLACLASGSAILAADYPRLSKGITEGDQLSEMMSIRPSMYPHLLQQMTMMGEETSQTKEGFGRAGDWFEQEVQSRVEAFQATLEPILMGLISLLVGTIVLAVFLPLYGLLDKLGV